MTTEFTKQWALKWAEGILIGFGRNRIELSRTLRMLPKAKELRVKDDELLLIIESIENSPVYLPSMTQEEKKLKFK